MVIQITNIPSSNVEAVTVMKHPEGNTVRVTFKNGGVYDYQQVSVEIVKELLKTVATGESVGKFIGSFIKPVFECVKVETQG